MSVGLDAPTADEATMETESTARKLVIHPTAGVLELLDPPCSITHLETLATVSDTLIVALCNDRFVTYRVVGGILQPEVEESAVEAEQYRWIGPPIKRIVEGRLVTDWLTASGEDFAIKAWRLSAEGIVERPLSTQLQNMDATQREIPMREAISEGGYIARVMQESQTLERWTGTEWMVIPSHLWVQEIHFSKYEDVAVVVAAERDPTAPNFDPIEQTLTVFIHDLRNIDSPWGQHLELETGSLLGYSFQGLSLPEWSHFALEPNIWWAVGRDEEPPTIKRLGLNCQMTNRHVGEK